MRKGSTGASSTFIQLKTKPSKDLINLCKDSELESYGKGLSVSKRHLGNPSKAINLLKRNHHPITAP